MRGRNNTQHTKAHNDTMTTMLEEKKNFVKIENWDDID